MEGFCPAYSSENWALTTQSFTAGVLEYHRWTLNCDGLTRKEWAFFRSLKKILIKFLQTLGQWDNNIKCHPCASCHQDVQFKIWQLACHKTDFTNHQIKDVLFTCASVFFSSGSYEKRRFLRVFICPNHPRHHRWKKKCKKWIQVCSPLSDDYSWDKSWPVPGINCTKAAGAGDTKGMQPQNFTPGTRRGSPGPNTSVMQETGEKWVKSQACTHKSRATLCRKEKELTPCYSSFCIIIPLFTGPYEVSPLLSLPLGYARSAVLKRDRSGRGYTSPLRLGCSDSPCWWSWKSGDVPPALFSPVTCWWPWSAHAPGTGLCGEVAKTYLLSDLKTGTGAAGPIPWCPNGILSKTMRIWDKTCSVSLWYPTKASTAHRLTGVYLLVQVTPFPLVHPWHRRG